MIVVADLRKRFEGHDAVAGVSFRVDPGEIYGLIGPNGAGKTTTMRMLVGLMAPTGGRATIGGVDLTTEPARAKGRLGFVTGTAGLYGRLTARELLAFYGELHGLPRARIGTRTAELAELLGMQAWLDRRCEKLSTGERQRTSIARAMLHDPPVLVLDEPTTGLDVLASRFLRDAIVAERGRGKAILYTTHYLAEAELLCDRVGLLHRGRLLAEDTPALLRARTNARSLEDAFLRLVGEEEARATAGSMPAEASA